MFNWDFQAGAYKEDNIILINPILNNVADIDKDVPETDVDLLSSNNFGKNNYKKKKKLLHFYLITMMLKNWFVIRNHIKIFQYSTFIVFMLNFRGRSFCRLLKKGTSVPCYCY